MSHRPQVSTLFISWRNSGNEEYVVGISSTGPQVWATGRWAAPSKDVKLMVMLPKQSTFPPVQNLKNLRSIFSSRLVMYFVKRPTTLLSLLFAGSAEINARTFLFVGFIDLYTSSSDATNGNLFNKSIQTLWVPCLSQLSLQNFTWLPKDNLLLLRHRLPVPRRSVKT